MAYIDSSSVVVTTDPAKLGEGTVGMMECALDDGGNEVLAHAALLWAPEGEVPRAYLNFKAVLPSAVAFSTWEEGLWLGDAYVDLPGVTDLCEGMDEDRLEDVLREAIDLGYPGLDDRMVDEFDIDRTLTLAARMPGRRCLTRSLVRAVMEDQGRDVDGGLLDAACDTALRDGWAVDESMVPSAEHIAREIRRLARANALDPQRIQLMNAIDELASTRELTGDQVERLTSLARDVSYLTWYLEGDLPEQVAERIAEDVRDRLEEGRDSSRTVGLAYSSFIHGAARGIAEAASDHEVADADLEAEGFAARRDTVDDVIDRINNKFPGELLPEKLK